MNGRLGKITTIDDFRSPLLIHGVGFSSCALRARSIMRVRRVKEKKSIWVAIKWKINACEKKFHMITAYVMSVDTLVHVVVHYVTLYIMTR